MTNEYTAKGGTQIEADNIFKKGDTMKSGSTKSILAKIESRFREGQLQRAIDDLPFEIQFQLGCSWGRALSYANDIRVRTQS